MTENKTAKTPNPDNYDTVVSALTETFGMTEEHVRSGATLESLELDSLSLLELGLAVEERSGVRLSELGPTATLDEVALLLDEAMGQGLDAPTSLS